jgi:hypothetical protein
MKPPKKLYKYVEADRVDILVNKSIRFTQPSALNDPFELQPLFEELFTEDDLKSLTNPSFEVIEQGLRKEYSKLPAEQRSQMSVKQLIEAVRANPKLLEMQLKKIEPEIRKAMVKLTPGVQKMLSDALQTRVGLLSLSESIEQPLLWAHYSAAHKGFAIEFDAAHSFFDRRRSENDELFHLRKVKYANRSSHDRTLSDLDGEDVLVTKESSWSYEKEWRVLLPLDSADTVMDHEGDKVYLYSIPASAISGVVLGARASDHLQQEISNLLQRDEFNHVKLVRATLDSSNQKILVNDHW